MALKSWGIAEIPPETVRAAHAVFPRGNIYIFLRDRLGTIYQDDLFADLYPQRGRPTYSLWRLALVTVFQFLENLTDRQAADAVRSRLDWKYALSLEILDPGFDHTVLSEFRTRLVAMAAEERLLEAVVTLCKQHGWLKGHGQQRTDSTHVLARSRALSRAECVVETLRHALNILSVVTPGWLQNHVQLDWLERYGPRASEYRFPSEEDKRQQFLHQVGQDGWGLLSAIATDPASQWMLSIPAVDTLQRIWKQDYLPQEQGGTWGLTRTGWRPHGYSFRPTTWMLQPPRNARPIGLGIKSILRKRVMKTGHILLHTWSPISALFQIEMSFQQFTQLYNDKNSFRTTTW